MDFSYSVSVLAGSPWLIYMPGIHLGSGTGTGTITGTEAICENGAGNANHCAADGGVLYPLEVSTTASTPFDSSERIPNINHVDVATDFSISAGVNSGSSAGVIDERFAETPEPASTTLFAAGIAMAAGLIRKRAGFGSQYFRK